MVLAAAFHSAIAAPLYTSLRIRVSSFLPNGGQRCSQIIRSTCNLQGYSALNARGSRDRACSISSPVTPQLGSSPAQRPRLPRNRALAHLISHLCPALLHDGDLLRDSEAAGADFWAASRDIYRTHTERTSEPKNPPSLSLSSTEECYVSAQRTASAFPGRRTDTRERRPPAAMAVTLTVDCCVRGGHRRVLLLPSTSTVMEDG